MLPRCFSLLSDRHLLDSNSIHETGDSFAAASCSLSELLARAGIHTFYNDQGEERRCERYFDDWYLYAVAEESNTVCSLFKMREQEDDAHLPADADTPGVTISFIAFDFSILQACLLDPSRAHLQALNAEINRVVAMRGQTHHQLLKAYWASAKSEAPYLIASLYTQHIASFAQNGTLPVPLHYAKTWRKNRRLRQFIESNNCTAGYTVCDHALIHLKNPQQLSSFEALAILATHTANTSFHSFAAEVQFHAQCLHPLLRVRLPGMRKSLYDSAVRADMTIDSGVLHALFPFYHTGSKSVRMQKHYHPNA